ncbi:MAG: toll/interleukin-1 receptor domain-containing protein [Hyphomicrobiaceae bacterium]
MSGKIFINYKRGDDPRFTGRLFDFLEQKFSPEQLFIDVDNIAAGDDFTQVLVSQVAQCDVMLSVIGREWLNAEDETGHRRLDSPRDFVRIEIESALRLGKRVIPVLVNNADMPGDDELPLALAALSRRNAVRLSHERFRTDAQGLVVALNRALAEADAGRKAEEAARAAEAARQEQVARLAAEREQEAQNAATSQQAQTSPDAEIAELERRIAEIKAREALRHATQQADLKPAAPVDAGAAAAPMARAEAGRAVPAPASTAPSTHETASVAVEDYDAEPLLGSKELVSGLMFLAVGAIAFAATPGSVPGVPVKAGNLAPVGLAGALIVVGALSLVRGLIGKRQAMEPIAWRTLAFTLAGCALFGVLVKDAGLLIALAALGAVSMAATPSNRFDWRAVATFVFFLGFTAFVFVWGLQQPIPLFGRWLAG